MGRDCMGIIKQLPGAICTYLEGAMAGAIKITFLLFIATYSDLAEQGRVNHFTPFYSFEPGLKG